jgi:ligand-binding sensor domain-containing protein
MHDKTIRWAWAISLFLALYPAMALGQGGVWQGYVDASLISEIDEWDGEFYIATIGGLLVYNPADTTFDQVTNVDGLPANFLTCVAVDNNGTVWVGTEESGMARLDMVPGGFDVTSLTSSFQGLSDDRITAVAAWGDTIAYGSQNGAGLIVKGFVSARFDESDGLPSAAITDVFPDGDRMWIATTAGVAFLDDQGFITNVSAGLPSLSANVFARDDTALWVGTDAGVARYQPASGQWLADGIADEVFSIRYEPTTQVLWAGGRRYLYRNDGGGWVARDIIANYARYDILFANAEIGGLMPTADGAVYLGFSDVAGERRGGHLMLYDGSSVRHLPLNGPPANRILRLSFDTDASLWVSSASFGVGKQTPAGRWVNYNTAEGAGELSTRFVNLAMLADSKGSKWFLSLSTPADPKRLDELRDGLDEDKSNDVWSHYDIGAGGGDGLQALRGQNAAEDPAGNLWFLADEFAEQAPNWWGINILSEDRSEWRNITPVSTAGGMLARNVTDVAFGNGGRVFVALRKFGVQAWFTLGLDKSELFDFSGDSWQTIGTVTDDFDAGEVNALELRREGNDDVLWIGTELGLYKWDRGRITEIRANRGFGIGLLSDNVRDLLLDRDENLWVATDMGLNMIARDDESEILSFTTPVVWQTQLSLFFPPDVVSPLADASCNALALHPTRPLLYIATSGGLSVLDISSLFAATSDLSDVYLYPNPIQAGSAAAGGRGDTALKIGNLRTPVDVKVFNLEGELVWEELDVQPASIVEVWPLTTETGFLAASGVYVVRVTNGTDTIVKRVALIR